MSFLFEQCVLSESSSLCSQLQSLRAAYPLYGLFILNHAGMQDYFPARLISTLHWLVLSLSSLDVPSPVFTSTASPWPTGNSEQPNDEHEHENDPYMSGNETDKENRAVGPAPGPTHGARVLFNDILSARAGTKAAVQPLPLLQPSVLPADDDPFAFTPSLVKARENESSRLVSPAPRHLTGKRGLSQMFEEEEGDGGAPVPALMIRGTDGDSATPGDGLVGFKPVLGGLSQAFEQTQVTYSLPCLYNTLVLTTHPNTCRTRRGLGLAASLRCAAV